MEGTIKKFNLEKGYGFIKTETADFYFHVTSFVRPGAIGNDRKPVYGERVTFDVGPASMNGKGKSTEAFHVRPALVAGLNALAKGFTGTGGGGAE